MSKARFTRALLVSGFALAISTVSSGQAVPPPCCRITAIDASSGVITAKPIDTNAAFRFTFDSGTIPGTLKIDQFVWSHGGKVSLNGAQNCCTIIPANQKGRSLLGTKISSGQGSYSADSTSHVRDCDQVALRSFPQGGHKCLPKSTMISSGKTSDGSEATYSWTCNCT